MAAMTSRENALYSKCKLQAEIVLLSMHLADDLSKISQ
jgi:hypothetical protein